MSILLNYAIMYTVTEELERESVNGEKTGRERQNINRKRQH